MDTRAGDIKLIHHNRNPVVYVRVEDITADVKPGWWQVRLLILQVPAREVTWILRDEYIDGGEFTMDGEPMRLESLAPAGQVRPDLDVSSAPSLDSSRQSETAPSATEDKDAPDGDDDGGGKVVDLSSRRRDR